jgi:hypothetical protein
VCGVPLRGLYLRGLVSQSIEARSPFLGPELASDHVEKILLGHYNLALTRYIAEEIKEYL